MLQKAGGRQGLAADQAASCPQAVVSAWRSMPGAVPRSPQRVELPRTGCCPGRWVSHPPAGCKAIPTRVQRPPALPGGQGSLQFPVWEPGLLSQLLGHRGKAIKVAMGWLGRTVLQNWLSVTQATSRGAQDTCRPHTGSASAVTLSGGCFGGAGDTEEGRDAAHLPQGPREWRCSSRIHGSNKHLGNTVPQDGG